MAPARVSDVGNTPNRTFRIDPELHASAVAAMAAVGSSLTAAVVALCKLVATPEWARYWRACTEQGRDPWRELREFVRRVGMRHDQPHRAKREKP